MSITLTDHGLRQLLASTSINDNTLNSFHNLDIGSFSSLGLAAALGDLMQVRRLLDAGANIECSEQHLGRTPLHLAVWFDRPHVVKLLLSRGAVVDCVDASDLTPLDIALAHGFKHSVSLLIAHGAAVLRVASNGSTALHSAVLCDDVALISQLVHFHGGDALVNVRDGRGVSPLATAIEADAVHSVLALIAAGVEWHLDDDGRCRALILAQQQNDGSPDEPKTKALRMRIEAIVTVACGAPTTDVSEEDVAKAQSDIAAAQFQFIREPVFQIALALQHLPMLQLLAIINATLPGAQAVSDFLKTRVIDAVKRVRQPVQPR